MARTIDHILATHDVAQSRRAAGKPIWDRRINVCLPHEPSDDFKEIEANRAAWASELKGSSWYKNGDDSVRFAIDRIDEVVIECADDVDDINDALDEMYDLADIDRVWIAVTHG